MKKYRVRYRLMSDYEMIVDAEDGIKAHEIASLRIDPDNRFDWSIITGVEEATIDDEN